MAVDSSLSLFAPSVRAWFESRIGRPTAVQEEGWRAVASGQDVLISAPTGTGKTLSAFMFFIDQLGREAARAPLADGVRVLYISPLKALGNDIHENLQKPLAQLGLDESVHAEVRTGDTPSSQRARMAKHPPQILITTPESLYLLLTSQTGRHMLSGTQCVICDEIHAMLNSKRGVHLALSLERLDDLCGRRVQRIGLSATVRPLESAAAFLVGNARPMPAIVAPAIAKEIDMRVEMPVSDRSQLHENSAWAAIAQSVYSLSQKARTTLAFVDSRAQAEKLAHHCNIIAGYEETPGSVLYARTHHGCISRQQRHEAEQQLRSGQLRILCATSSMELGIDVGDIDLVVQIGAPASISALLQRAGRAGHGPGRTSMVRIFPKTDGDALYCALAARGALEGMIEPARMPQMCLDVLSQHLVSMAAAAEYSVDEALALCRRAWAYRDLTCETLEGVLCMLAGDHEHTRDLPVRPRLLYDRISATVSGDRYTRMLACSSGGTIPDRGWYPVTLPDGRKLGELDEEYVFEARLGDKFLLGAFAWRITDIRHDRVIVEQSTPEGAQTPFWKGDMAGRDPQTGEYYGKLLHALNEAAHAGTLEQELSAYPLSPDAIAAIQGHILRQIDITGTLAEERTLLVEHFSDEAGQSQLMLHCPLGKRVNRPLAMLLRALAQKITGQDVHCYDDDDGVLLYLMAQSTLPDGLIEQLRAENISSIVRKMLPGESVFSMSFRYAAGRALMLGMRSGGRVPLWVQRLRSAESFSSALEHDGHPLLCEAERECMQDLFALDALETLLRNIRSGAVHVREIHLGAPSPFSLPLRRQLESEMTYLYSPIASAAVCMAALDAEKAALVVPEEGAFALVYQRPPVSGAQELHSRLMTEGDLLSDEPSAHAQWLEELAAQERVLYTDQCLWIAAEERTLYEQAAAGDMDCICRIARRCMRYRGPANASSLAQRYCIAPETAQEAIDRLLQDGHIVRIGAHFVHKDIFSSAQQATIRLRREQIQTRNPERLCALLAHSLSCPGPASEQLDTALRRLYGLALPAEQWESIVLPARVSGYKPQLLDALLSSGEFFYQISVQNERLYLAFYPAEREGDECLAPPCPLSEDEAAILRVLETSGAMFAQRIGARLSGAPVEEPLRHLLRLGLVRKDSFAPVRQLLAKPTAKKHMPVLRAADTGRWTRSRAVQALSVRDQLTQSFARCPLLCRETVSGMEWRKAIAELRRMEYTAQARRGCYISALSGAQFLRSEDFERVCAFFAEPAGEYGCLSATDPDQLWGRVLPHMPDRQFLCVAQTAVVLYDGRPAAVFERSGEVLRVFEQAQGALCAFAAAYRAGRVFPDKRRICCKKYPPETGEALRKAGFQREALDYVLERR